MARKYNHESVPDRQRRLLLAGCALPLLGCESNTAWPTGTSVSAEGDFAGASPDIGHRLQHLATPAPTQARVARRTRVLIVGAGVAALAAARALRLQGVHDMALLELEDEVGGNARSTTLTGLPCPMGAHYLPVPGDDFALLQDWLEEVGLRQRVAGRWHWNERHLCHSPQERLHLHGHWQEGLLPMQGVGATTLAQYRRFAAEVRHLQQGARWRIPVTSHAPNVVQLALDTRTMDVWLREQALDDTYLHWYLDYCCRDEYGAGLREVSAWAAIHYFASRHGFRVPGDDGEDSEGLFTWPQGNAWLIERLAAPLVVDEQRFCRRLVTQVTEDRHGVQVDALDLARNTAERWQADICIVATPIHVAARIVGNPIAALRERATQQRQSAWVVANLHVDSPLADRGGAAPSWDNVRFDPSPQASLGYVNATHQSLRPVLGASVLTWYQALGTAPSARQALLERPWTHWRDTALADLALPHPDLPAKLTRTAVSCHGHAMAVPVPGTLASLRAAHAAPVIGSTRVRFAHSDWAGYSVFEEAFALGHKAGATKLV